MSLAPRKFQSRLWPSKTRTILIFISRTVANTPDFTFRQFLRSCCSPLASPIQPNVIVATSHAELIITRLFRYFHIRKKLINRTDVDQTCAQEVGHHGVSTSYIRRHRRRRHLKDPPCLHGSVSSFACCKCSW